MVSSVEHAPPPSLIRVMGRVSLTAAIINGVIGSGIFGLPSAVAALTGAWSPLAVVVAGACVFLVLLCFAEVGSRFDQAGGPYLYAREAFGPTVGFQVGWLLLVSRLLACAAALNILIVYLGLLAPAMGTPAGRVLTMTAAMTIATAINVTGIRVAAWTTNVFTVAKLLPLVLLVVAGLPQLSARVLTSQVVAQPEWREAVLLLVFAYGGFESMVIAASETRNPRKDTGPALIAAGIIVTLIYCLLQLVIVGVLPDAARSTTPVASALREVLGGIGGTIGTAAVIVSVYGWLTGFTLMMPRVLYSMATHGELPAALRRVHPVFRTPHVAIVANAFVALAMGLYSSFAQAATFAAIARLTVFASTCAALLALKRRGDPAPAFRLPGSTAIAIAGAAFSVWLLATRSSTELWILLAVIGAGVVLRGFKVRLKPDTTPTAARRDT
jgi:APA family basic amino acid/polyamine antiporter